MSICEIEHFCQLYSQVVQFICESLLSLEVQMSYECIVVAMLWFFGELFWMLETKVFHK